MTSASFKTSNPHSPPPPSSFLPSPHPHTHPHPTNNPCTTFFTKLDYNCDSSSSGESSESFSKKKNQPQREGEQQQRKRISKGPKTSISKNKNTRKEIIAHLEFYCVFLGWVFLLLACLPACLELQFLDLVVVQGRTVDAFNQSVSQSVRRLLTTAGRERLDTQSPVQPHTVPVTYVVMGSGVLQSDDEFCVGWCGVALLLPSPRPLSSYRFPTLTRVF